MNIKGISQIPWSFRSVGNISAPLPAARCIRGKRRLRTGKSRYSVSDYSSSPKRSQNRRPSSSTFDARDAFDFFTPTMIGWERSSSLPPRRPDSLLSLSVIITGPPPPPTSPSVSHYLPVFPPCTLTQCSSLFRQCPRSSPAADWTLVSRRTLKREREWERSTEERSRKRERERLSWYWLWPIDLSTWCFFFISASYPEIMKHSSGPLPQIL